MVVAIAAGVALERRSNRVAVRVRQLATRLLLWVLVPFIVYASVARIEVSSEVAVGLGLAHLGLLTTGVLAWRLARGRFRLDRPTAGAAIVCTIQANTGFVGLPICAALFTHAEFAQAVVYDALVSLPVFVFGSYSVGALFGTTGNGRSMRRHLPATLLSTPLIPVLGIALVVPDAWAPEALEPLAKLAAYALAPLAFVIVGITLADEAQDGALRIPPPLTRPVAAVMALRMGLMPAIMLLGAALLGGVPPAYPVMAAMPVGLNTILVAHQTGLNARLTVDAIVWSGLVAGVALIAGLALGIL